MQKIKAYLDEDVRPLLAKILRERGYDAVSCIEKRHFGLSDEKQLSIAAQNKRAILTHSIKDFIPLHEKIKEKHYGIILSEQIPLRMLLKRISKLLSPSSPDDIKGTIIWLSNYK